MKTHYRSEVGENGVACGTWGHNLSISDDQEKITCTRCKKLLPTDKPEKMYAVKCWVWNVGNNYTTQVFYEKAATASKANYKVFKGHFYNDDACENIYDQFGRFKEHYLMSTKVCKNDKERTLTYEEKHELEVQKAQKECDEWNEKYPIGTEVLFQADFKDKVVIKKTTSLAQRYETYNTIFLEGVSGCYHLDPRWVRPLTAENKNMHRLRSCHGGAL